MISSVYKSLHIVTFKCLWDPVNASIHTEGMQSSKTSWQWLIVRFLPPFMILRLRVLFVTFVSKCAKIQADWSCSTPVFPPPPFAPHHPWRIQARLFKSTKPQRCPSVFYSAAFIDFIMTRLGILGHSAPIVQPIACISRWELDCPVWIMHIGLRAVPAAERPQANSSWCTNAQQPTAFISRHGTDKTSIDFTWKKLHISSGQRSMSLHDAACGPYGVAALTCL